jgi:hypothetical protein
MRSSTTSKNNTSQSNIGGKRNNLAGSTSIAPNPKPAGGKVALEKPPAKLPAPTGVETITPVKTKNVPRSYVPSRIKQIFDPAPFATPVVKQPPAKKPTVVVKPPAKKPTAMKPAVKKSILGGLRSALGMAPKATFSAKPPATRFGVVTGTTTGTRVSGGGGYGGGGTRGGGSLSGQGSGSRQAGTSRTGGTKQNNPVRG